MLQYELKEHENIRHQIKYELRANNNKLHVFTAKNDKKSVDERQDERHLIRKYTEKIEWYKCCKRTTRQDEKETMKEYGKDPRKLWSMVAVINTYLLVLAIIDITIQTWYQMPITI
jgi:hypothetical protein